MELKYICPLITVQNIEKSRKFYEEVLNQEVEIDHGTTSLLRAVLPFMMFNTTRGF